MEAAASGAMAPVVWRFADAEFRESTQELRVQGSPVALERKPLEVLRCLLHAEGELVTKNELFDTVWAGRVVTDGVLSQAIWRIREVLGDSERRMLRTVHGYGFRLDVPIAIEGRRDSGTRLRLQAGVTLPGLDGWVLDERLGTRPHNELWRIRNHAGDERRVVKLALSERAARALKREVTLNRVMIKELGVDAPVVPLRRWQFDAAPPWILMPWYPGGSLADWVARQGGAGALSLKRRVAIVAEAAEVLAQAHALGIMHKDIKPGNLLVDESGNEPRLLMCDFGSGTVASRERLERVGVTLMGFTQTLKADTGTSGTPAYMAPEVLAGGLYSERSDVYSLGVLLYQLVAGDLNQPLAPGWEDDIADVGLRDIVAAACAGKPERRIASMLDLAERLRGWSPEPVAAGQDGIVLLRPNAAGNAPWRWWAAVLAGLALVIGLVISLADLQSAWSPQAAPGDTVALESLAVLPFQVFASAEEDHYLALGLHEAVLTDLAQIASLRVISRGSVMAYADDERDIRQIAEELGVDALIETSFQHEDNRIRVSARLTRARDGTQLWAGRFDRTADDIFAMQTELAQRITDAVGAALSPAEARAIAERPTISAEAYAAYLTANALYAEGISDRGQASRMLQIRRELQRAVALDEDFVEARVLLVQIESLARYYAQIPHAEAVSSVTAHLDWLETRTPDHPLARFGRGMYALYVEEDPPQALALIQPVVSRLPPTSTYLAYYADLLRRQLRVDEALLVYQRAVAVEPRSFHVANELATTYALLGQGASAFQVSLGTVRRLPSHPIAGIDPLQWRFNGGGDVADLRAYWARMLQAQQALSSPIIWYAEASEAYVREGPDSAAKVLDAHSGRVLQSTGNVRIPVELYRAILGFAAGRPAGEVAADADTALKALEADYAKDRNTTVASMMVRALALSGRGEEARALMDQVKRQMPRRRDAVQWHVFLQAEVVLPLLLGDEEGAVEQLPGIMRLPLGLPSNYLRYSMAYAPVMSNPRTASVVMQEAKRDRIRFLKDCAALSLDCEVVL